jgi:hypothetical protein
MEYLNQAHKEATERKLKAIEEDKKHPVTLEEVLQKQRRREQMAREMEKDKTDEK